MTAELRLHLLSEDLDVLRSNSTPGQWSWGVITHAVPADIYMTDEQIPADIFTEGGEHGEHGLYIGLTDNPKDAAYIVALVDADRAVEQPPRKKRSENRQRRSMTAVRLLPDEHEQLRQAADQRGLTLSEFIRSAALTAASDPAVAS